MGGIAGSAQSSLVNVLELVGVRLHCIVDGVDLQYVRSKLCTILCMNTVLGSGLGLGLVQCTCTCIYIHTHEHTTVVHTRIHIQYIHVTILVLTYFKIPTSILDDLNNFFTRSRGSSSSIEIRSFQKI